MGPAPYERLPIVSTLRTGKPPIFQQLEGRYGPSQPRRGQDKKFDNLVVNLIVIYILKVLF